MIGLKRLDNLQYCIETVIRENIPGDLIETGVWRGGACIFMRGTLAAYGIMDRKDFVTDSFEGLPETDKVKYPTEKSDRHRTIEFLAVSEEEVGKNFKKYDLLDGQVIFLKGWFKYTHLGAPIEKLSILRLDGDIYGSTIESLINLYPKLSIGGYCMIDDCIEGFKKAVVDCRSENKIDDEIKVIDWSGIHWRKS